MGVHFQEVNVYGYPFPLIHLEELPGVSVTAGPGVEDLGNPNSFVAAAGSGGTISARYTFAGHADDTSGTRHGVVSGGAVLVSDRAGNPNEAYSFGDDGSLITAPTPFPAGNFDFSIAMWMKPIAGSFDGNWHGFIGYHGDSTHSPSMSINHAGTDCNPQCGMGPGGNNDGPGSDDGGALDPDGQSQSGVHYDTRTTQAGDGTRFGGVVDAMFAVDTYVHLVWASVAGGVHYFYKDGVQVAVRPAPPVGVDLHDSYRIGGVGGDGGEFVGVIDEVSFFDFALTDGDVASLFSLSSASQPTGSNASNVVPDRRDPNEIHALRRAVRAQLYGGRGSLTESACLACEPGWYDNVTNRICEQCPAGRYGTSWADTSCQICPVGTASLTGSVNASSCVACTAGKADTDSSAATPCEWCPAGTFATVGQTQCTLCAVGRHVAEGYGISLSACMACRPGTADEDSDPSTFCTACPAGQFSGDPGATECAGTCSAGTYGMPSSTDTADCIPCATGLQDQDSDPSTPCTVCPVGWFSEEAGVSSCAEMCPAGTQHTPQMLLAANVSLPAGRRNIKHSNGVHYECQNPRQSF